MLADPALALRNAISKYPLIKGTHATAKKIRVYMYADCLPNLPQPSTGYQLVSM